MASAQLARAARRESPEADAEDAGASSAAGTEVLGGGRSVGQIPSIEVTFITVAFAAATIGSGIPSLFHLADDAGGCSPPSSDPPGDGHRVTRRPDLGE